MKTDIEGPHREIIPHAQTRQRLILGGFVRQFAVARRALRRIGKQIILPANYESLYGAIVNRFSCENGGAGKIPLTPPDLL